MMPPLGSVNRSPSVFERNWKFIKVGHAPLNQAGLESADYFPNQREFIKLEEKRGSFNRHRKYFSNFPLAERFSLPKSWSVPLLAFLPGIVSRGLKQRPGSLAGQACPFASRGTHTAFCSSSSSQTPFIRALRVSFLKKPGELDCLFSTQKVFI